MVDNKSPLGGSSSSEDSDPDADIPAALPETFNSVYAGQTPAGESCPAPIKAPSESYEMDSDDSAPESGTATYKPPYQGGPRILKGVGPELPASESRRRPRPSTAYSWNEHLPAKRQKREDDSPTSSTTPTRTREDDPNPHATARFHLNAAAAERTQPSNDHDAADRALIRPETWNKELVAEINRVLTLTHAVYAVKGDLGGQGNIRLHPARKCRDLTRLPATCLNSEVRRILTHGTLKRTAYPRSGSVLKLGFSRNTNLLALLLYLTGDESPTPCSRCESSRQMHFGSACVVSTDSQTREYMKHACASCYFNKNGHQCHFHREYKRLLPYKRPRKGNKNRKAHQEPTTEQQLPIPTPFPEEQQITARHQLPTQNQILSSPSPPPPAPSQEDLLAEAMGYYTEVYGATDTNTLLAEQQELTARLDLLNQFLRVRFQQIMETT